MRTALRIAALAPLLFASRHQFAALDRLLGLQATLHKALDRLANACADDAPLHQRILAWRAQVPADDVPRAQRIAALSALKAALEGWPPAPAPAPTPAPTDPPAPRAPALPPASAALPSPATPARRLAASPAYAPDTPLADVRGVGERVAASLATRELRTIEDLLRFVPRRYRSREGTAAIATLRVDTLATVEGHVQAVRDRFMRGRRTLEVMLHDGTGMLMLAWFRVPGRSFAEQFHKGARFLASGTVRRHRQWLQMAHPEIRRTEDIGTLPFDAAAAPVSPADATDAWSDGELVPLYLELEGLHPNGLRRLIDRVLPAAALLVDPLPVDIRRARQLCDLNQALCSLHQPPPDADIDALEAHSDPWHRRLIYEELFFAQLALLSRRAKAGGADEAVALGSKVPSLPHELSKRLPFVPTDAQYRVMQDIDADLRRPVPMQRLVQGDVGSGKTAVAWVAAMAMIECGQQVAMMAPTELLAEQHARNARALAEAHPWPVALLTGSTPTKERRRIEQMLVAGEPLLVIGTHALIAGRIRMAKLGLVIVDEQHRFGVLQRARLREVGLAGQGLVPHMIVMTATPIPRTLAMTVYGELDVSVIDALPPNRKSIHTRLYTERERTAAYARVREQIDAGRQAYVVFPLVEASDKEGMEDVRAATESAQELADGPLKDLRIALLHGRVTAEAKEAIMQQFAAHQIDVLVATTVVEVGIDVANATVIVIEHAERFGLSQLHQLRGRVGRGAHASQCVLVARAKASETAVRRLQVLIESNDGFRIAEEDLELRGPGDVMGTRQSGLPMFALADLTRDGQLLADARADAQALLERDASLSAACLAETRAHLARIERRDTSLLHSS